MTITQVRITSIEHLKTVCEEQQAEFALALQGGLFSRKYITYNPNTKKFLVEHCIDDTVEKLTEAELRAFTSIGEAIKKGHFYQLIDNYD